MEANTLLYSEEVESPHLELESLSEVVQQKVEAIEQENLTDFLGTFLTKRQLEVVEIAAYDGPESFSDTDARMWSTIKHGVLRHPAVVGKVAFLLSGVGTLEEVGEEEWKEDTACKEDVRFVIGGKKSESKLQELSQVCDSCPVFKECQTYAGSRALEKGFWAGEYYTAA